MRKTVEVFCHLLLEIANGIIIGVCEEVSQVLRFRIFFQMVHESRAITLNDGEIKRGRKSARGGNHNERSME